MIDNVIVDPIRKEIRVSEFSKTVDFALERFVTDLAQEVENKAKEFAPEGDDEVFMNPGYVPGSLKEFGVVRIPTVVDTLAARYGDFGVPGSHVTPYPAFGGGHTVRGGNPANVGRFSSVEHFEQPGYVFQGGRFQQARTIYSASVILNPEHPYAWWVHQGTGIHGPLQKPITSPTGGYMKFRVLGKWYAAKQVEGQAANPFLDRAYEFVNNVVAPVKLQALRAELDAL